MAFTNEQARKVHDAIWTVAEAADVDMDLVVGGGGRVPLDEVEEAFATLMLAMDRRVGEIPAQDVQAGLDGVIEKVINNPWCRS